MAAHNEGEVVVHDIGGNELFLCSKVNRALIPRGGCGERGGSSLTVSADLIKLGVF